MKAAGWEGIVSCWLIWLALLPSLAALSSGCDLAGPRPVSADGASPAAVPAASPASASGGENTAAAGASSAASPGALSPAAVSAGATAPEEGVAARCIHPLAEPPPPIAAPARSCPPDPDGPLQLPLGQVRFFDAPSAPQVTVELALTDPARARGLMYRTQMDGDHGMLFSWEDEAPRSFWMRNTCIPLDMLFIAGDGTVVGILEQVPTLNTLPRQVPCPARHVLELNAGWTRAHGVIPGQRVELEGGG